MYVVLWVAVGLPARVGLKQSGCGMMDGVRENDPNE